MRYLALKKRDLEVSDLQKLVPEPSFYSTKQCIIRVIGNHFSLFPEIFRMNKTQPRKEGFVNYSYNQHCPCCVLRDERNSFPLLLQSAVSQLLRCFPC